MNGAMLEEWEFLVEEGKVREFARAVRDPRWQDAGLTPPPTFPIVISAGFIERLVTQYLTIDRSRTVHGEERYDYFGPIEIGDTLRCVARMAGDEIKEGRRGGRMRIMTVVVDIVSARTGKPVCRQTMTTIEKDVAA